MVILQLCDLSDNLKNDYVLPIIMNLHNPYRLITLDHTVLTSLGDSAGLASPLVQRVITLYRQEAEKMVHGIDNALHREDWQAAFRLAHTLKSSSASVGAYALSEIAKQIESLIRQQQSQQACALVYVLRAEYQQVMSELAVIMRH